MFPRIRYGSCTVALGQPGIEIGEDVQVGSQRLAVVHIGRIDALPEKRFARDPFQSLQIDLARRQQIRVLLGEILAHHADQADIREIAGGKSDICGRAAQHSVHAPVRRFKSVIRDGSNDDK